ncbi:MULTISPECIES: MarR family transcriptional regulator [Alteribacter]|uniref:MarR family transcriptional regulator n=1 Tax=Alteribacter keqinensis TaxID=2483800 RepID=A0A3M7TX72_9BACI|nr:MULTISPECIES: MarR family transcriptional regulator [Alteribacter]MBM7097245.1 MarR family transcriptional regulator [Alteribacter salitolerans]RNA69015.1 MarR family transcriptional regulator [Alteribacter keqinensis]
MTVSRNNHLLMNYIRGMAKTLEEEWQTSARDLGLTLAEQHIMWIVYLEEKASISRIAKVGLWDRSTVMQVIKRLVGKGYVKVLKDDRDLRVSYVILTEEGKVKRQQTQKESFELFDFIEEYQKKNPGFMEQLVSFHREANRHFHGDEFVDWVETTTKEYDIKTSASGKA